MKRCEIIRQNLMDLTKGKDYGICDPPLEPQEALNELIRYFLGDDWYVTMPESTQQTNTAAIFDIERIYRGNRKSFKNLKKKYKEINNEYKYNT